MSQAAVPSDPTDDALMMRVQSGETAAFALLVERYQGPLFGFFYRNTRDRQFAEDLTQETLLKVYNQAWDYLPLGRFRGWMYRIGRNLMIDNLRRQSHDVLIGAVSGLKTEDDDGLARVIGEVLSPRERAEGRELFELVDELLGEIPVEQRMTFTLHHYAELPLAEVAEIMETNTATCKSRLRLAREKLREKLRARGVGNSE